MSNHKMAMTATIVRNGAAGTRFLYIDGELFPWYTTDGLTIEVVKSSFTKITLSMLVEGKVNIVTQPNLMVTDAPLTYIEGEESLYPLTVVEGD